MGQVLFVAGNLFAFLIAVSAADMAMRDREPWRRALATVAGFPLIVLAVVLILGNIDRLSAGAVVVVLGVVAIAIVAIRWRRIDAMAKLPRAQRASKVTDKPEDITSRLSLGLLAAFGGVLAAKTIFLGTAFSADDLSYHAPAAAHWLVDGRLSLAPLNYHAYYPLNAEAFSSWFMLPFRSDAFASLSGFYWALLAVFAIIALCLVQGRSRSTALLCAGLFLASKVVTAQTRTFSAVDLAGAALVLASLALAVPSSNKPTQNSRLTDAAYSGLLAGFATGAKVSFAPITIPLVVWFAWGKRGIFTTTTRAWSAMVFVVSTLLTGSYWYVRNFVLTGNPLFPAAIGPFDGPFGAEEQYRTKLIYWMFSGPTDFRQRLEFAQLLDWGFGLGLLALLGYGVALRSILSRRDLSGKLESSASSLMLLIGLMLLLLHPLMPFSGTTNDPEATLRVSNRFLIAPFAIGLIMFSSLIDAKPRQRRFWYVLTLLAAATGWIDNNVSNLIISPPVAVVAAVVVVRFGPMLTAALSRRRPSWATIPGLVLATLILLSALTPYKQYMTDAKLQSHNRVGGLVRATEFIPVGARVTAFGPNTWQYYPLFGRKFELVPRRVRSDGSPQSFVPSPWWSKPTEPDLRHLVTNLRASGVDYVVVEKEGRQQWPLQQSSLARAKEVRLIHKDTEVAVWRIGD